MSFVGITASSMVFYIYDTLHEQLFMCVSSWRILGVAVDCNTVLSSSYNMVFGVNLDLLAISYFLVNMGLVLVIAFGSDTFFRLAFKLLFVWRFIGIVIVPYLMTIEFVVLRAVCIYCTIMHFAILVDFAVVTYFLFWKDMTVVKKNPDAAWYASVKSVNFLRFQNLFSRQNSPSIIRHVIRPWDGASNEALEGTRANAGSTRHESEGYGKGLTADHEQGIQRVVARYSDFWR